MESENNIRSILAKLARRFGAMALVAVASSGITYYVCERSSQTTIAYLQDKIAYLNKVAFNAHVTQRESQQLEDIANQQRLISDKQKEEAVKQSHIADMERNRAELESGLARQAEYKAVRSARQADSMRVVAEGQTELATKNMVAAEQARAKADTLFYRSLANSLAQSSLAMGNSSNLSRLLSYASWTYDQEYGNGEIPVNIYKALLFSSESIHKITTGLKGNIRAVNIVSFDDKNWAFGITDYGEAFYYDETGEQQHYQINDIPFRDMVRVKDQQFAAIGSDGRLVVINANGMQPQILRQTQLSPDDVWLNVKRLQDGTLVAMSQHSIAWIDGNTMKQKAVKTFGNKLETLGFEYSHNIIHMFGENGIHYSSSKIGEAQESDISSLKAQKQTVTAYSFDNRNNFHILGTESGKIFIVNNNGEIVSTLNGHTGRVSSVRIQQEAIVSTSYDNTMRFWSLDNRYAFAQSMDFPVGNWPMAFVVDERSRYIWIGGDNGNLTRFCISPERNAATTQSLLHREFSELEWKYFVGNTEPYRTFMKGGAK